MDIIEELRKQFHTVQPIEEGYSHDRKFRCDDVFVRVFKNQYLGKRMTDFKLQERVYHTAVPCPRPLYIRPLNDTDYMMAETVAPGCPLADVITRLPLDKQYQIGWACGQYQQIIHQLPSAQPDPEKMVQKIRKHQQQCQDIASDDILDFFHRYVETHIESLRNRPLVYMQGDFHINNFFYHPIQGVILTDFNRSGYSDPLEEMVSSLAFSSEYSRAFVCGQWDSYGLSNADFRIFKIYCADSARYSVYWAQTFGEEQVSSMIDRAHRYYHEFSQFNALTPYWYQKGTEQ